LRISDTTSSKNSEIKGEWIKCPNCGHEFDSDDTFDWLVDKDGHPTIEYLSCPKCNVATEPIFSCTYCPGKNECILEEECGATLYYNFDEWKVITK